MSPNPYEESEFSFSTPLKLRLVAYFRKYYDLDIKDEEADLFLNSLVALYDALSKEPRKLGESGEAGARGDSPRPPAAS